MKILRQNSFSKTKEDRKKEEEKEKGLLVGGGTALAGGAILSTANKNKLTGRVVRYHNTPIENVDSILENGIKASYANDPNSYTRTIIGGGVEDKTKLDNLVYTAKRKIDANGVGATRAYHSGKLGRNLMFPGPEQQLKLSKEALRPKHSKTLKIVLDYEKDIKGSRKIRNPELDARRFFPLDQYTLRSLDEGTHIFDHDIDPSKIKGSRHFKKRTMDDVKNYIKRNPKRFGKEAAKVVLGTAAIAGGAAYAYKQTKGSKNKKNKEK